MDGYIFIGKREQAVNQRTALSPANCRAGDSDQCGGAQGTCFAPQALLLMNRKSSILPKPSWVLHPWVEIIILPSQGYCAEWNHKSVQWALVKCEAKVSHWRNVDWNSLQMVLWDLLCGYFLFFKYRTYFKYWKIKIVHILKCGIFFFLFTSLGPGINSGMAPMC